jgi:hypothetical protein
LLHRSIDGAEGLANNGNTAGEVLRLLTARRETFRLVPETSIGSQERGQNNGHAAQTEYLDRELGASRGSRGHAMSSWYIRDAAARRCSARRHDYLRCSMRVPEGITMISAHILEYAALAAALAGLAAIVIEIGVKDPSLFGKIEQDVRGMATPPRVRSIGFVGAVVATIPANSNEARKAAA